MKYIIYSQNDKIRNDFGIELSKYLSKNEEIYLIDLDSKNRDLAEYFDVCEYTIYDTEDVLNKIVDITQASIDVNDNLFLLSSSVIDKYDFSKDINFYVENYILLVKNYNVYKNLNGEKFYITDSIIENINDKVVSYGLGKKELKILSKKSNLVSYKELDNFIEKALDGKRIEFKNIFEKIFNRK